MLKSGHTADFQAGLFNGPVLFSSFCSIAGLLMRRLPAPKELAHFLYHILWKNAKEFALTIG